MTFTTTGAAPVLLSLPAWTPGAYEISNFARWVDGLRGDGRGRQAARRGTSSTTTRGAFARRARRSVQRAASSITRIRSTTRYTWAKPDFLLFNGTNLFLYPEGNSLDFASTVTVHTEADWNVTTGMAAGPKARTYTATNYHDLVDMPFFVGQFDLDSARIVEQVGAATRRIPPARCRARRGRTRGSSSSA